MSREEQFGPRILSESSESRGQNNNRIRLYVRAPKGKKASHTVNLLRELKQQGLLKIIPSYDSCRSDNSSKQEFAISTVEVRPHNVDKVKEQINEKGKEFCILCTPDGKPIFPNNLNKDESD